MVTDVQIFPFKTQYCLSVNIFNKPRVFKRYLRRTVQGIGLRVNCKENYNVFVWFVSPNIGFVRGT